VELPRFQRRVPNAQQLHQWFGLLPVTRLDAIRRDLLYVGDAVLKQVTLYWPSSKSAMGRQNLADSGRSCVATVALRRTT
jgi:hypothetical protein